MTEPKKVREVNWAGPCLDLGTLVAREKDCVIFINREGRRTRRGGMKVRHDVIHTEPCPRCMDHPETVYPEGYCS